MDRLAWRRLALDTGLAAVVVAIGLFEVWAPLPSAVGDGSPVLSSVGVVVAGG
jgi:hypothetical protein